LDVEVVVVADETRGVDIVINDKVADVDTELWILEVISAVL
jgi:hypothetical protein